MTETLRRCIGGKIILEAGGDADPQQLDRAHTHAGANRNVPPASTVRHDEHSPPLTNRDLADVAWSVDVRRTI